MQIRKILTWILQSNNFFFFFEILTEEVLDVRKVQTIGPFWALWASRIPTNWTQTKRGTKDSRRIDGVATRTSEIFSGRSEEPSQQWPKRCEASTSLVWVRRTFSTLQHYNKTGHWYQEELWFQNWFGSRVSEYRHFFPSFLGTKRVSSTEW